MFLLLKITLNSTCAMAILFAALSPSASAMITSENDSDKPVITNAAVTVSSIVSHTTSKSKHDNKEHPLQDRGLKPYFNALMGSHFFLRPVFPEDYTAFLPVFTDEGQMKYLGYGKPITTERARQFALEQATGNISPKPKMFSWSVITYQGIAGRVFLSLPTQECPEKELGYFICPAFAGRGLATDASRLAMDFMEGPFMATVHPLNLGSAVVLKKLGFKADPNRLNVPRYGSIRDFYLIPDHEPDTSASLGDVVKRLVPKMSLSDVVPH